MLADRMFRAAMLDPLVFDEIKEDRAAMFQAVQVIVIVAVIGIVSSGGASTQCPSRFCSTDKHAQQHRDLVRYRGLWLVALGIACLSHWHRPLWRYWQLRGDASRLSFRPIAVGDYHSYRAAGIRSVCRGRPGGSFGTSGSALGPHSRRRRNAADPRHKHRQGDNYYAYHCHRLDRNFDIHYVRVLP